MDATIARLAPSREADRRPGRAEAEAAVETLLRFIGEDPAREGLAQTPARVVRAYEEMFAGYAGDAHSVLSRTFSQVSGYEETVLVRDIEYASHCEHHMLPVIGRAHIAYRPDGAVLGLSKLPRIVEIFSRRLTTQEAMTQEIADALMLHLAPKGVAVQLEAEHLCMVVRGVRKPGATTVTQAFGGCFSSDERERERFLAALRR